MEAKDRVQWVYGSQNNQELTERYDQWAVEYDLDLDQQFGWNAPRMAAELMAQYTPKGARVLDAGAGTGLVGVELHRLGYRDLVAIDLSEGMLGQARAKGVYGELHKMELGKPLGFPSDSFGATICVGVFTLGHAPANSLDELVRVTQPGGYVVFTLRPDVYENNGFRETQEALVASGSWNLVEVTDGFQALPKGEPEVLHQIWAYQVTIE